MVGMRARKFKARIAVKIQLAQRFTLEQIQNEGIRLTLDGRFVRTICSNGHHFDPEHNQSCPECEAGPTDLSSGGERMGVELRE